MKYREPNVCPFCDVIINEIHIIKPMFFGDSFYRYENHTCDPKQVKGLDLKKLEKKVDDALKNETKESLDEWRKNIG